MIELATLIFVQSGLKRIRWAEGDCVANPGDAIAEGNELRKPLDSAGREAARARRVRIAK